MSGLQIARATLTMTRSGSISSADPGAPGAAAAACFVMRSARLPPPHHSIIMSTETPPSPAASSSGGGGARPTAGWTSKSTGPWRKAEVTRCTAFLSFLSSSSISISLNTRMSSSIFCAAPLAPTLTDLSATL